MKGFRHLLFSIGLLLVVVHQASSIKVSEGDTFKKAELNTPVTIDCTQEKPNDVFCGYCSTMIITYKESTPRNRLLAISTSIPLNWTYQCTSCPHNGDPNRVYSTSNVNSSLYDVSFEFSQMYSLCSKKMTETFFYSATAYERNMTCPTDKPEIDCNECLNMHVNYYRQRLDPDNQSSEIINYANITCLECNEGFKTDSKVHKAFLGGDNLWPSRQKIQGCQKILPPGDDTAGSNKTNSDSNPDGKSSKKASLTHQFSLMLGISFIVMALIGF